MKQRRGMSVSLARMARLRQGTYRLLASLLMYPDPERLAMASLAARLLRRDRRWVTSLAFFPHWDMLLRRLSAPGRGDVPGLQAIYYSLFMSGPTQKPIPLCEREYVAPTMALPGQVIATVETAYAMAGLKVSSTGNTPDHLATEMEFLSALCGREAQAWQDGDAAQALQIADTQRRFLERHLFRWLPLLENAVTRRERDGFYAEVIRASWALIAHDVDMTGLLISRLREAVKVH